MTTTASLSTSNNMSSSNISCSWWNDSTESAIYQYNDCTGSIQRNDIFEKHLYKPLSTLVAQVYFTYFANPNNFYETPENIQAQTLTFVVSQLHMCKPDKGKAISYFITVAKHYLIQWSQRNSKQDKKITSLDTNINENEDGTTLMDMLPAPIIENHAVFFNQYIEWLKNNVDGMFISGQDRMLSKKIIDLVIADSTELDSEHSLTTQRLIKLLGVEDLYCIERRIDRLRFKLRKITDNAKKEYLSTGIIDFKPLPPAVPIKRDTTDIKYSKGENRPNAKLTNQSVLDIVKKHNQGIMQKDLAEEYGVSPATISGIITGTKWSSVTGVIPKQMTVPDINSGSIS